MTDNLGYAFSWVETKVITAITIAGVTIPVDPPITVSPGEELIFTVRPSRLRFDSKIVYSEISLD